VGILIFLILLKPCDGGVVKLDAFFDSGLTFLSRPEQLEAAFPAPQMEWMSQAKERAVIRKRPFRNVEQELHLGQPPIHAQEATIEMNQGQMSRVTISVFNRGDAGVITREKFMQLIKETQSTLDRLTKVQGIEQGRQASGAVKVQAVRWTTPSLLVQMESSYSKDDGFLPEFLRVRLAPAPVAPRMGEGNLVLPKGPNLSRSDLTTKVKKETSGDVWISGVPMIDQGDKGYCVVASCERVFRFLGIDCDQHELAQLAGSSSMGTSTVAMAQALDKLEGRFKVRFRQIIKMDFSELAEDIKSYDKIAKRKDAKTIQLNRYAYRSLDDIFDRIEPESWRQAREKGTAYSRFWRDVKSHIDRGVPMLWSMRLGWYPEEGKIPQSSGGHMRMIIGYNESTKELIYSDSWGEEHAFKKMAAKDGYAATTGLYAVEPRL
jgi:hypothetical protein